MMLAVMVYVEVIAAFVPFLIAGLIAVPLSAKGGSLRLIHAVAIVAVVLYVLLVLGLPFCGLLTELMAGAATAIALIPVIWSMSLLSRAPTVAWRALLAISLLPLSVGVLMPWTIRVSYAQRVAWACDGTIVSKYRSDNHGAPTLAVQTAGHAVTLEGVEKSLWQKACIGERLVKPRGSAFGTLEGIDVRIVPRALPWWNEPGVQRQ